MDIRRIIREEVSRVFSENYPLGSENDPNAPWNQVDNVRPGEITKKNTFIVYWMYENQIAFLKGPNGSYVMNLENIDQDMLEPYADREREYLGKDEDGMPDVEYGDWEITPDVIENYVNDNPVSVGSGLNDWESGEYELVMLDDELRQDLLGITKFINNEKTKQEFVNAVMVK